MPAYVCPSHKLRDVVDKLYRQKLRPEERYIVSKANDLLKHQEIVGTGFWSSLWSGIKDVMSFPTQVLNEVPFLKTAVGFAFPAASLALAAAPLAKYIYGTDTNKWLTDALGDFNVDPDYKGSDKQPQPQQKQQQQKQQAPQGVFTGEGIANKFVTDLTGKLSTMLDPSQVDSPYAAYNVPNINSGYFDSQGNYISTPDALKFPKFIGDFREKAKSLREYLIHTEQTSNNLRTNEYKILMSNQQPYRFLDFPQYNPTSIPLPFQNISKNHYKGKYI